jgi:hypothetical protein
VGAELLHAEVQTHMKLIDTFLNSVKAPKNEKREVKDVNFIVNLDKISLSHRKPAYVKNSDHSEACMKSLNLS